jgi:uncharacterized protein (DUF2141 family)
MKLTPTILAAALVLSTTAANADQPELTGAKTGTIVFHMTGLVHDRGKVRCGLYTDERWLAEGDGDVAPIRNKKATCTFKEVPYGVYGIAAFHDEDDDGELDTRIFIPTEPGCLSNNAKPRFGPPSFKRSRFNHDEARTALQCMIGRAR